MTRFVGRAGGCDREWAPRKGTFSARKWPITQEDAEAFVPPVPVGAAPMAAVAEAVGGEVKH